MTGSVALKGAVTQAAEQAIDAIELSSKKAIKRAEKTAATAEKALAKQAKAAEKALARTSPSTRWIVGALVGVAVVGTVLALRKRRNETVSV